MFLRRPKSVALFLAAFFFIGGLALAQWPADIKVETDSGNYSTHVYVTSDGMGVYELWRDHRPPGTYDNGAIYFNYSHNKGVTWGSTDQRIDVGKVQGANMSDWPAIACSGVFVYAVWQDHRNDPTNLDLPNVYFNRSTNGGMTWGAQDVQIDTGAPVNTTIAENVSLRAHSNYVYVCWKDERNGLPNVYFSMSDDYGQTWSTPGPVDPTGSQFYNQQYPVMDCDGTTVYAAWQDSRNANQDIYFNHSSDAGVTWNSGAVRRVDTDNPALGDSIYLYMSAGKSGGGGKTFQFKNFSYSSQLVGSFGGLSASGLAGKRKPVYCIWRDYRNSQGSFMLDIFANVSTDSGVTWGAQDARLNSHHSPGTVWVGEPVIAGAGEAVYGVWLDEKDDPTPGSTPFIDDVYLSRNLAWGDVASWSVPIRMDEGVTPGFADSWNPQVAASGSNVWVVWMDDRDDQVNFYDSVYCTYSTDKGDNWTFSERVDSGGTNPGAGYCEIWADGSRLNVAFRDYRFGAADAFYNGRDF